MTLRARDLALAAIALVLVVAYLSIGSRIAPAFTPASSPTPTPSKPVGRVSTPTMNGTIVFAIRGDVYVLANGGYVPLTSEGRSHEPSVSPDGRTVLFARIEEIDRKRNVDGQTVPAHLRFSNVVRKDTNGGAESILVNGLVKAASGFHEVTWFDSPAPSPDGQRVAAAAVAGGGYADRDVVDAQPGQELERRVLSRWQAARRPARARRRRRSVRHGCRRRAERGIAEGRDEAHARRGDRRGLTALMGRLDQAPADLR